MIGYSIGSEHFGRRHNRIEIRYPALVVGGEKLQGGPRLPQIRAFMDDMTTMRSIAPCTSRLLDKLNSNLQWARMKVKPSKSRSLSIVKGKVVDKKFAINEEIMPTVLDNPTVLEKPV